MSTSKVIVIGTATVDFLAVDLPALPDGRGDEFGDRTLVFLPGPPRVTIGEMVGTRPTSSVDSASQRGWSHPSVTIF